jgi:stress response protein YsnF
MPKLPSDPSTVPSIKPRPASDEVLHPRPGTEAEAVIPLSEEVVRVDQQERVTGKVRVRTVTDIVEEVAGATLQEDTVEVTRVPVDRVVDAAPEIRTDGDVTIVPVLEEVLVVEKRLVLKEELHIRRRTTAEQVEVPVTVQRQRAVVEHIDADGNVTEK